MSEKIFACLLRLYPAPFRQKYGSEAVQLCRDRLRDESGAFRKVRLYCEFVVDGLRGIPRAWHNSYPESSSGALAGNLSGLPSFHLLDRQPLRPGSIVAGCLFSLTVLVAFGFVMRLPAPYRSSNSKGPLSPVEAVLERLNRFPSPTENTANIGGSSDKSAGTSQAPANPNPDSPVAMNAHAALSAEERDQVVTAVAQNLNAHYFDPQKAQQASEEIRTRESQGVYTGIIDGPNLAERLTADLRSATGDQQLNVEYSRNTIPVAPDRLSAAALERYRAMLIQENCAVEDVEILANNIGYVKIDSFPDMEICGAKIRGTIARISRSNAIIFDLRDNLGGSPDTVAAVSAFLFDRTVPWYNPRANPSSTMLSPAAGSMLAKKPVYIITSSHTFSGAEHFTYNLKMLKRATVIGETTGGAAHAGVFYRVDDHFGVGIPKAKISNPFGTADWAGVGVEPDVKVKAADALGFAEKLAAKQINH